MTLTCPVMCPFPLVFCCTVWSNLPTITNVTARRTDGRHARSIVLKLRDLKTFLLSYYLQAILKVKVTNDCTKISEILQSWGGYM